MVTIIKSGMPKREIHLLLEAKKKSKKRIDIKKYCGIIKLKEDPVKIQKRLRDEWR